MLPILLLVSLLWIHLLAVWLWRVTGLLSISLLAVRLLLRVTLLGIAGLRVTLGILL